MNLRSILLSVIISLITNIAFAQIASTDLSGTITNSSASCIPANALRKTLYIENLFTNTVNVGYCIGAACTAAIGTAGTSILVPGQSHYWPLYEAPPAQFNCIAGAASVPITARSSQ
jgi:hypothetical protein